MINAPKPPSGTGPPPGAAFGPEPELNWSAIAALPTYPEVPFTLSDDTVDAYLDATSEWHPLYEANDSGFVPPLIATLVRLVKGSLGGRWPSGTIQLDHRIATFRPLRRGEHLTIDAQIRRAELRNGKSYFETVSILRDASRSVVGEQSSTSMWAGAVPAPASARVGEALTPRGSSSQTKRPSIKLPEPAFGPVAMDFPLERLRAFGRVAGALDPIHVDVAFGQRTRYGSNIAQGRLVMTLLSRLMLQQFGMDWLHGNELTVRFIRPVLTNETVYAWGAPAGSCDGEYQVWCENDANEPTIVGSARTGLPHPGRSMSGHSGAR